MTKDACRVEWNVFPSVWMHAKEMAVKRHSSYGAAKSGNPDAAFELVSDVISEPVISQLREALGLQAPVLESVHAVEDQGVNAIPEILAETLAHHLGWNMDSRIVQTNIVGHTGADGFSRLARQPKFAGPVISGACYVLVDDFVGQGGTLANLRSHIILGGGRVIGATVLTGKSYSALLAPRPETLDALRSKHGDEIEDWWRRRFGFGFECLTESEAAGRWSGQGPRNTRASRGGMDKRGLAGRWSGQAA